MKKLIFLSVFLIFCVISCQKDKELSQIVIPETPLLSQEVTDRNYDEIQCGEIPDLCVKCMVKEDRDYALSLKQLGGTNGQVEGIDNNFIRLFVGQNEYIIRPAKLIIQESKEYVITAPDANYVNSDIQNEFIKSKSIPVNLPKALEKVKLLDFDKLTNGQMSSNDLQAVFGSQTEILQTQEGNITIRITDDGQLASPSSILFWNPCEGMTMNKLIFKYKSILGLNQPHLAAEEIIFSALMQNLPAGFNHLTDCPNTQNVVATILANPEISGSSHASSYIKLNYLKILLDLSKAEYEWLYNGGLSTNFGIISEIYENIISSADLTNCANVDCVRKLAAQEYVENVVQNGSFTSLQDLVSVYAKVRCMNNPFLLDEINDLQNSCFPSQTNIADLNTLVSFCESNPTNQQLANFIGAQIEAELACDGETWVASPQWFDEDFWEILFELLKEVAPELIPGVDTALELKAAIEAANNGDYYQSAANFAMAVITLTPLDECKDFIKVFKVSRKAYKVFRLFDKLNILNPTIAEGFKKTVLDRNKMEKHLFVAKHYLDNVVKKVGSLTIFGIH